MIDIDFKMPDLEARVKSKLNKIYLGIAASIQTNRAELFYNEGSYNGHKKWAPLKFRSGMILQKSGNLRRSMAPDNPKGLAGQDGIVRFEPDKVTVGTKLFYAAMMNFGTTKMPGGVLKPVKAKALKIPVQGRGKFIFRKSVKIPARRFDEWTADDQIEIEATVANLIAGAMRGKI